MALREHQSLGLHGVPDLIGRLADLQGVQQQQQCMRCPMFFFHCCTLQCLVETDRAECVCVCGRESTRKQLELLHLLHTAGFILTRSLGQYAVV